MVKDGAAYYYHADGLGSIVAITDANMQVVQRYSYESFGRVKVSNRSFKNIYTYTGREWDGEIGLHYYRARYYDPMAGRFISKDPIGFAGGDVNLYRYVGNGPVVWIDPSGLLKYNTSDTDRTGRLLGKILEFAECMEKCAGFELTVTGGSEKKYHGKNSKHYSGQACDFSDKRNPKLTRKVAEKCYKKCAKPEYYGQQEGGKQPHYHFQVVPGRGGAKGFASGVK